VCDEVRGGGGGEGHRGEGTGGREDLLLFHEDGRVKFRNKVVLMELKKCELSSWSISETVGH
jgi:hypothetical protein